MRHGTAFVIVVWLLLFAIYPASGSNDAPQSCDNDYWGHPLSVVPLIDDETCNCNGEMSITMGIRSGETFIACPVGWQPGDTWGDHGYGTPTPTATAVVTPTAATATTQTMTPTATAQAAVLPTATEPATLTPTPSATATALPASPKERQYFMPYVQFHWVFSTGGD